MLQYKQHAMNKNETRLILYQMYLFLPFIKAKAFLIKLLNCWKNQSHPRLQKPSTEAAQLNTDTHGHLQSGSDIVHFDEV